MTWTITRVLLLGVFFNSIKKYKICYNIVVYYNIVVVIFIILNGGVNRTNEEATFFSDGTCGNARRCYYTARIPDTSFSGLYKNLPIPRL